MFDFKVSYLKWIIIAALLFGVLTVVNNNLLKNSDEQKDGFEDQKNQNKLSETVNKLTSVVDKLEKVAETFKNATDENVKDDDEDDEDDADNEDNENNENDDDDDETEVSSNNTKKRENFRRKSRENFRRNKSRENFRKNKSKEKFQQPLVEKFSNYTTGVASSFGGDYLLLN